MKKINLVILTFLLSFSLKAQQPYSVEYYYKVKWGYFDEFMDLYKKNHYPILKELKKQGEILDMKASTSSPAAAAIVLTSAS